MTGSKETTEFSRLVMDADRAGLLLIKAVCLTMADADAGQSTSDWFAGYSKGELKRTIRTLRKAQQSRPDLAEGYERAVAFIRGDVLHKAIN